MMRAAQVMPLFSLCLAAIISIAQGASGAPQWGPGATAKPEKYGYQTVDVKHAETFINETVKGRTCFLMAKNGEIIYESGNRSQVYKGYSMTKTIGFLMVLMAASKDELDIDADITEKYGIPSPKTYGVSARMMMSMVLGGEAGPGELWRYDELGDMWLSLLPKVLHAATGKSATTWFQQLHKDLGLSQLFTWPAVETNWGRGASGPCEDWGRFAQLVLNRGYWNMKRIISPELLDEAQEPAKYDPYNFYSNPCYGLGWWLNSDKEQYNGCCWEASRLPPPNCNDQTFIQGATHKLTFTLGLYGQVVLAIKERNVTVVSMGYDLRPIEPIRIGVYPGVCKMLGLPCNDPPKVPQPKCGESLECLGMSAQCYSGYEVWSHEEPQPGGAECVACFQQRVRDQAANDTDAQAMIRENCPLKDPRNLSHFLECFCYDGDNVFSPWPSTTTTTPAPKPMPPVPHPYTTTAAPKPLPCDVSPQCWAALHNIRGYDDGEHNKTRCVDEVSPQDCGLCLFMHWGKTPDKYHDLVKAGCPTSNWDYETVELCLCGPLDPLLDKCVTKVSGVCNSYHTAATLSNSYTDQGGVSGRRRRAFGCTAPPGGSCQVGSSGKNSGEIIMDCYGHNNSQDEHCFYTSGPSVRTADNRTNFRFWSNHTGRKIVGENSDNSGQPAGNKTYFAHTCGWHEQWSVVIDTQGGMSLYPSGDGLMCPSGDSTGSSVVIA